VATTVHDPRHLAGHAKVPEGVKAVLDAQKARVEAMPAAPN
jgi:hypothetical protein